MESENTGAATIRVTGACHENIFIRDLDPLTIAGVAGASVSDAPNDARDVLAVDHSNVTLAGLAINGNPNTDGVDC